MGRSWESKVVRKCLQRNPQGKRPRGRPRVSWQETAMEEMKAAGLNWETPSGLALSGLDGGSLLTAYYSEELMSLRRRRDVL